MTKVSDSSDWESDRRESRAMGEPSGRAADRLDLKASRWRGAFKAAGRHTARVAFLRWAMLLGAVVVVASIAAFVMFDSSRRLPANVSIGEVSVVGTRVTVATPKIAGYQTDGRPYEVKARAGVQETTAPSVLELFDIDASVGMMDASTVLVTALHGVYDGTHQKMAMNGDVRIWNEIGYDIRATSANVDFEGGVLASDEPVIVLLDGGTVTANQMDIRDNGHKVSFMGDVRSLFEPASDEDAEPLKEAAGAGK